jgi:tetratricopeptide (TPR) repeat protein
MQILPNDIDTSKILWEFYHFNNDTDDRDYELLIEMSEVVMKYRPDLNALYFQAQLYIEMEDYQRATDTYNACLKLCEQNPDLNENIPWLQFHLANSSYAQEKYEEAIEFTSISLEKYLELNINGKLDKVYYPLVMSIRARLYADLNNIEQALKDVETGLVYDPDNHELLNLKEELENN